MLTHFDLFSGIGGFSIAAEACGFQTVAFAETDPDASAVLKYWWPAVPNLGDVNEVCEYDWCEQGPDSKRWLMFRPDLLTGGVPCQPASHVGQRRGTLDERWMWPAAIRVMRHLRPAYAVYENPPAILTLEQGRAFNGIVSEMVALGYDLWWDVFPAAAFGAGHLRERLIIIATDANSSRDWQQPDAMRTDRSTPEAEQARTSSGQIVTDANGQRWQEAREQCLLEGEQAADDFRRQPAAHDREATADACHNAPLEPGGALQHQNHAQHRGPCANDNGTGDSAQAVADTERTRLQGHERLDQERSGTSISRRPASPSDLRGRVGKTGPNGEDWWSEVVTGVPVLAHGLPNKLVEAISRCTGNAVVPQTLVPLFSAIADSLR